MTQYSICWEDLYLERWTMSNWIDTTDLATLTKLNELEIKFLWEVSNWDGPMSGVVEYQGKQCWFEFAEDVDDGRHYRHVLYPLSDEHLAQLNDFKARREAWSHEYMPWDNEEGYQVARKAWDEAGLNWPGPDLTGVKPIGWFMDGANQDFYGIQLEKHGSGQKAKEGGEAPVE